MVADSVDSAKVRELEEELNGIRSAFKDYISNTREMESGFDNELGNMHNKLATTANANVDLANRLQTMGPLTSSLETSLDQSKKQLLEESRLRREMEQKLKAVEGKNFAIRQEFDSLREENGALREELDGNRSQWEEFRSIVGSNREMRQSRLSDRSVVTDDARRSDCDTISAANLTKSSIPLDDAYLEVLDELETVTEQFISTQQKLWMTEDKLGTTISRIEDMQDQEQKHLATKKKLLAAEARLRELEGNQGRLRLAEARMNQLENQMVSDEALHARVLELEKELVSANNYIQFSQNLSGTNAVGVGHDLQIKLQQTATENEMLLQQVALLQQHIASDATRSEATTMMEPPADSHDHDVEAMRRKIDQLSDENSALQTTIFQLENNPETVPASNANVFKLKDEIENLQFELTATKDKHRLTLLENDAAWRRKLEKARGDTRSEVQAIQNTSEGKNKIVEGLQQQINSICKERDLLERKAVELESSKTMLENENTQKGHHICDIEGQLIDAHKEKSKLEQNIRSLKTIGQASAATVEKLKVEQDMIETELKALEPWTNSQNGKEEVDRILELDLIDRVRKLCTLLQTTKRKPQEGELNQIEELRGQLDTVTEELMASKTTQKRLRRAIHTQRDQGSEIDGIRSQFRLMNDGECQPRNRYARDPEPVDAVSAGGFQRWMPNANSHNMQFPSHSRSDPPTRDSQPGNSSDFHWLLQQLVAVDGENRILRSKFDVMGSSSDETTVKHLEGTSLKSRRDVELRKETIRQLEKYLENEKLGNTSDAVESDILLKLTAERQDLQNQVVELKQALATSELAKNESEGETSRLQHSILCLKETISKLRKEYNRILQEAEEREQHNRTEIAGFATHLNELAEINKELEGSNNDKVDQIQTLTQEISSVQDSLHAANERYEGVAKELESIRKMVDDVRQTAEQKGREVATAELRAERREERVKERLEIQTQLNEAHQENIRLSKALAAQSEGSSKSLQTFQSKLEDTVAKSQRWQRASEKASQEMTRMMEEEKRLKMELEALANELDATQDELDFANASLRRRRADLEKLKRSKSLGLASTGTDDYKVYRELHHQIQQVITKVAAVDNDTTMHSRKTEGFHLKAQLMDIDMSIGKISRENIMLEEELDHLKNMMDETREAAEKKGRREATREAWSEIRERQENEIRDFKDQFSSLVEENRCLETQLRNYESSAKTDSKNSTSAIEPGNADLRRKVELSNLEAKKLSQECLTLRLTMESMKDEHEQIVDELKMRTRRESEGVSFRLQNEVRELRSDISEMQQVVDESSCKEKEYIREIKRLLNLLATSQKTLEKVNEERHKISEAMKEAKSSSTQVIEKLRSQLLSSSQEIAELSSKSSDPISTLVERKKDLLLSRQANQNHKMSGRQEVHDHLINSSSRQEYTNELEATLKLSRDEVRQSKDYLLRFKSRVQYLEKELTAHLALLKATKTELAKERLDSDQTIKVLGAINSRLNSVEGMTPGHELGMTTETTKMAERLEWRVEKLLSIMSDFRLEKEDQLKVQLQQAETSEKKFSQAKQEASRLEDEVSRLLNKLNTTKNTLSNASNSKEDLMTMDTRRKPEIGHARNIQHHDESTPLPSMKQASDREPRLRTDPEPRHTMESDIISEVVSMKSMESTDYIAGLSSEVMNSGEEASQKLSESVDIRSEADCAMIDVENGRDPPSQNNLLMENAIYHV